MNTLDDIIIIGLTGQSGAGKSTVSKLFEASGLPVIDCDKVAHRVTELPGFISETAEVFPACFENGVLQRKKLGATVFNDHSKLLAYGKIIFPYISAEIFKKIRELRSAGERIIVLDAPTLFESGMSEICSAVVSVVAPLDLKLKRVLERDNIPVEFAKSRLSSQFSEQFFSERSNYLIVNDGDLSELSSRTAEVAAAIKERYNG